MIKKIFVLIFIFALNQSSKAQNRFNLDSLMNILKFKTGDERQKLTYDFYENIINSKIPKFKIKSIRGETINSDSLIGKVIVINFWFMACHPCIEELPMLNELANKYKDPSKIEFLGMTRDDSTSIAKNFIGKFKFDFKIIPESEITDRDFCIKP